MASGFPDWQTPAGRVVGGESISSFSFSKGINAGATDETDIGEVAAGTQEFYQALVVTVQDDTSIHRVNLTRISDNFTWWIQEFVTSGSWEIPGFGFGAGDEVRIKITNNSGGTLTFIGAIFKTVRRVS